MMRAKDENETDRIEPIEDVMKRIKDRAPGPIRLQLISRG